nr:hypothetical protein [Tanacetum cinerariifolium]
ICGLKIPHQPPFAPKPKNPPTPKKDNPAKDVICHQYGKVGHKRRNCPIYLSELMKKKKLSQGASTSVSCLYKDGFVNHFENDNSISVFKNNMIYFNDIPRDDIYEIVMSSSNANDSSVYDVSNKRAKLNLDSALLWHCRLRHINKKRIEKLQHDELLDSADIGFFKKYVACMFGNMARKPYSHQVERAKDLLGLIHTDVCGPFKIMARQGAYYFITFTDDFSRHCYVYLLKHKHEVFETFKVFQKEVEKQLEKTIKSLRSDRVENSLIAQEASGSLEDLEIIQEEDMHPSIDTSLDHEEDDQEIDEPHVTSINFEDNNRKQTYDN